MLARHVRWLEDSRSRLEGQAAALERSAAALRESETRFRDFAEAAADWVWEMDEALRFTYVSERYFDLYGIPVATVLGKPREELADTGFEPERWRDYRQAIAE